MLCSKISTRSCVAARGLAPKPVVFVSRVAARAGKPNLGAEIEKAVKEAEETCAEAGAKGKEKDCVVAWDNVEEISAASAHKKAAYAADPSSDPLEAFCLEDPSADECRVYED